MKERTTGEGERRLEAAAAATGVAPSRVRYFIRVGLVQPSRVQGSVPLFGEAEMAQLRRIRRLRDDLGLNMAGIEVALRLLDEIESLRRELGRGSGEGALSVSRSRHNRAVGRDMGESDGQM